VYVALDTTNRITTFDTAHDKQIESLDVVAPESIYMNSKMLGGANSNALALTPDERMLLVSNGGENAVAVVRLGNPARDMAVNDRKASIVREMTTTPILVAPPSLVLCPLAGIRAVWPRQKLEQPGTSSTARAQRSRT
jgi:hypothetical protein